MYSQGYSYIWKRSTSVMLHRWLLLLLLLLRWRSSLMDRVRGCRHVSA